jgi:hypothetical protein
MAFHIRLRRWLHTADSFNLTEQQVRHQFVDPWLKGEPIVIGGRTWIPHEARITIIEGPELTTTQRSFGQGIMNAHELGEVVTDRFLHSSGEDGGTSEDGTTPSEPTERPEGDEQLIRKGRQARAFFFGTPVRIGFTTSGIFCLIGIVAAIIIAGSSSGVPVISRAGGTAIVTVPPASPTAPNAIRSAADLRQYILSRPIWKTAPTTFADSINIAFNRGPAADTIQLASGVPVAYSVSKLISDGASLANQPVEPTYIVGRVVSSIQSPVATDGWNSETVNDIVLSGAHGPDRVYALVTGVPQVGDVVYFPGVVAAVGTTEGGSATTYVIGLDDPQPTSEYGLTTSDTVAGLAKQFGQAAVPSQLGDGGLPFIP